jgi:hypothetical protein
MNNKPLPARSATPIYDRERHQHVLEKGKASKLLHQQNPMF